MIHDTALIVAPDHPAFAGHFPGRPILPGVVLLGWVVHALGELAGEQMPPCSLASAKFLRPVGPGASLRIRHTLQSGGGWRFDVFAGDETVATGSLRPAAR
jgi:3-hydroxymyristoyl/3-hydroxydecanoyl-(acyl carrier protein) dehydratase